MTHRWISVLLVAASLAATCAADEPSAPLSAVKTSPDQRHLQQFIVSSCLECHDKGAKKAGLALDDLLAADIGRNAAVWEKVVRKLTARQMPPKESLRPKERDYDAAVSWLEASLDAAAAKAPKPGRTETFRRLTRTEYQNAIRDLLGLEVDVAALLSADESSVCGNYLWRERWVVCITWEVYQFFSPGDRRWMHCPSWIGRRIESKCARSLSEHLRK